MPLRACTACGDLVEVRAYRAHRRGHDARPSSGDRDYGADWRRRRAEHLELEPFCRFHLARGIEVQATDVDHIVARRAGGTDEHSNLRSLCHSCHSRRTAIDQSGWGAR